jgi:hypothetical protein|tara:strand:+ start:226 stop:405 length:180 start_codon:yes stop_codon:yes gene_type:complete
MGSPTTRDFPADPIAVECKQCDRHGRYRKAALIEKYGSDIVLPYSWISNKGRQSREVSA